MPETFALLSSLAVFLSLSIGYVFLRWRRLGPLGPEILVTVVLMTQFAFYPVYARLFDDFLFPTLTYNRANKDLVDAQIIALASYALLLFIAGAALVHGLGHNVRNFYPRPARPSIRSARTAELRLAWFSALLTCGLAYALLNAFISQLGGLEGLVLVVAAYRAGAYAGSGLYTYPALVLLPVAFLYLLNANESSGRGSTRSALGLWVLFLAASLPPALLGFRIYLATFWLACLVILNEHFKLSLRKLAFATLLALLIFAIYGSFRASVELGGLEPGDARSPLQELLSPFWRARATDIVEEIFAHSHGSEWFGWVLPEALASLIPRELRPDFIGAGDRFGQQVMYEYLFFRAGRSISNFGGFSPNLIGFGLWQGGGIGLSVLMLGMGGICGGVSHAMRKGDRSIVSGVALALAVSAVVHSLESPQDAISSLLIKAIFLVLLHAFILSAAAILKALPREASVTTGCISMTSSGSQKP